MNSQILDQIKFLKQTFKTMQFKFTYAMIKTLE